MSRPASLDLGMVGNGSVAALIDRDGRIVWCCVPGFDGDPVFCALLSPVHHDAGYFEVALEGQVSSEQHYLPNTAVLVTTLRDGNGAAVEILDCAPRFKQFERIYHPLMLLRRIRPLAGEPRITVRLRPTKRRGAELPDRTWGSNHVRYVLDDFVLRATTDVPLPMLRDELPFVLDRECTIALGPDETFAQSLGRVARDHVEQTCDYWRQWVRYLSIPVDWQEQVIRAAITLKLCQYEGTGAIIAAVTTSIPESPGSPRNWDYRYCWLRDAAFVVRALNRLGATRTMEEYIRYVFNIATAHTVLQPLYGIHFEDRLHEEVEPALAGYRGMGPVRFGNDAWRQQQNDVYGSVVLAASQLFFDRRLESPGTHSTYARLERLGAEAARRWDEPDAGLWEYRGRSHVHTYSSVMCWAACDRLGRIGARLGLEDRAAHWRGIADPMRERIVAQAWSARRGAFVEASADERLDASALLFADLGFVAPDDPRFVSTVETIGRELGRGDYVFRYRDEDDFGTPETAFTICSFWYVEALAAIGQRERARELFDKLLARCNPLGLLSEDIDVASGELWGNYPQTYSLVGLIHAAMRLSRRWEDVV
ncbi:MAG TPA: glycoside hydrolase family 15 protein [Xanthomonadales bacterium]|nr:glycoside hydrolase family 15 protein [Xanthomonadales bacterium]